MSWFPALERILKKVQKRDASEFVINAVISSNVKKNRQAEMSGALMERKRTFQSQFVRHNPKKRLAGWRWRANPKPFKVCFEAKLTREWNGYLLLGTYHSSTFCLKSWKKIICLKTNLLLEKRYSLKENPDLQNTHAKMFLSQLRLMLRVFSFHKIFVKLLLVIDTICLLRCLRFPLAV